MAALSAAVAAGSVANSNGGATADACNKGRPNKGKLWLSSSLTRPLYVAEAQYKPSRYFNRAKKSLLVLYGSKLLVLDVSELETSDGLSAATLEDTPVGTLRYLSYAEVFDVSLVGNASMKIRHRDASVKPKLLGSVGLDAASGKAEDSSGISSSDNSSKGSSLASTSTSSMANSETSTTTASGSSTTSVYMSHESFMLVFKDGTTVQAAAAALMYQRAQHAAAKQWLQQGLHAGFRCDVVSLHAVHPAHGTCRPLFSNAKEQVSSSQPVPWGKVTPGSWGSTVALPAGWQRYLAAAAAANKAAGTFQSDQVVALDDLACASDILQGPAALQLCFATPLGLATATIQPQHVRAALLSKQCQQVLAVPVCSSSSTAHQQGSTPTGFRWTVSSMIAATAASESSAVNSRANSRLALLDSTTVVAENAAGGVSPAAVGEDFISLNHEVEVFAAVTLDVLHTPHTAGMCGCSNALARSATAAADKPVVHARAVSPVATEPASAASTSSALLAAAGSVLCWPVRGSPGLQLATYGVLAVTSLLQLSSSPLLAVLQLLLVTALVARSLHPTYRRGIGLVSRTASSSNVTDSNADTGASSCSVPVPAISLAIADLAPAGDSPSLLDDPGMSCCGWSILLVAGDIVSNPSRYLQLQISMATADEGLVKLRQRMASLSASCGGAIAQMPADELQFPTLVSEPEPAWLTTDIKQRFLNLNSSIPAARSQAQRTHKWRVKMDIDNILNKPCPWYSQVLAALPTYLLAEDTTDGNAVVLTEVGRVKDLCDLVFTPPAGTQGVSSVELEHTLAVLNEYLVQVAAPGPLPGGCSVRIFDMEGFKLSYAMGDITTLFKILSRLVVYYPDRLALALIINTPGWFAYPWKLLSSFLDANTRARVLVVGAPSTALSTIAHHMGGLDKVPVAWGGCCAIPLAEYPSHKRMMKFAASLNKDQQPLNYLQK